MPDQPRPDAFAQKFRLALEALNWSRTRCARELGLDKSVISRWAAGSTLPTEQNLSRLTARLQQFHPGFRPSTWRLEPDAFATWLQSDATVPAIAPPRTTMPGSGQPSIAVLAFDNLSGNPADEFLGHGMAEDLITELSRSRSWLVISRNSSFTFRQRPVDIRQVGVALGVRYVLEGSIQRSGDRIRVNVQLIDAESRLHVWAERYDRALTDLFATQDDITRAVSLAIEPAVETAERSRLLRKRPDSLDAWEAWQRARTHFDAGEWGSIDEWLRRSIELDPAFASPHASRAFYLYTSALEGRLPFLDAQAEADVESHTAIGLDPGDPAAHAALSMSRGGVGDRVGSLASARLALELGPSVWTAECAMILALIGTRQFADATRHLERLRQIGPRGAGRRTTLMLGACLQFLRGEYDAAAAAALTVITTYPNYAHPYRFLLASVGHLGRRDETAAPLARWVALAPGQVAQLAELGIPWWDRQDSDRVLAGLRLAGWDG